MLINEIIKLTIYLNLYAHGAFQNTKIHVLPLNSVLFCILKKVQADKIIQFSIAAKNIR